MKLRWILSHVIPGNDVAEHLAKLACNNDEMTNLNLEYEEYYSLLRI